MNSAELCVLLKQNKFDFFTGVPCSILSSVIKSLSSNNTFQYIPATREDEAIGIAVGAQMAGKQPVVLMQNSGLGNSINALTSLALLYECPFLMVISWRGYQGMDEPEHKLMGAYMLDLLRLMKIPYEILKKETVQQQIITITETMRNSKQPAALIVRRGIIE